LAILSRLRAGTLPSFLQYGKPQAPFSNIRPSGCSVERIDGPRQLVVAAILVLVISAAFAATINSKLEETFRIPTVNEYYHPENSGGGDACGQMR
jgi:hypothetical protein